MPRYGVTDRFLWQSAKELRVLTAKCQVMWSLTAIIGKRSFSQKLVNGLSLKNADRAHILGKCHHYM